MLNNFFQLRRDRSVNNYFFSCRKILRASKKRVHMPQQVRALKIWMSGNVFYMILASSFQNKLNIFFKVTKKAIFPNWTTKTTCFTSSNASYYLLQMTSKSIDIYECKERLDDCAAEARCTNRYGSFECRCLPGYSGDGRFCNGTYNKLKSLRPLPLTF